MTYTREQIEAAIRRLLLVADWAQSHWHEHAEISKGEIEELRQTAAMLRAYADLQGKVGALREWLSRNEHVPTMHSEALLAMILTKAKMDALGLTGEDQ